MSTDGAIQADTESVRSAGTEILDQLATIEKWTADVEKVKATFAADGSVDGTIMPAASATLQKLQTVFKGVEEGMVRIKDNLQTAAQSLTGEADGLEQNDSEGVANIANIGN